jgi:protein MpaA
LIKFTNPKNDMSASVSSPTSITTPASKRLRSIAEFLTPLGQLSESSPNLIAKPVGRFEHDGESYEIPRYTFIGPKGGSQPIRIGIFAGIHGDEPQGMHALIQFARLLDSKPELVTGYCLFLYPVCNPTGIEDNTRHARSGKDLNREFWRQSAEPEVRLLQAELVAHAFDGIIALHSDNQSDGFYGFVRGATLTQHLLRPALAAANELLPLNQEPRIEGFHAVDGLIRKSPEGGLSAPPRARPKPFEIVLATPGKAPHFLQAFAFVVALQAILAEYRKFIAIAQNI